MKKALDISHHQTAYNAAVTAARGVAAVFCRVAYATSQDTKFAEYAKSTLSAGMALGSYGFCTWHYKDKNGGSVETARTLMRQQTTYWASVAVLSGVNSWFGIDLELEKNHECGLSKGDLTTLANEAAAMLSEAGLHPVVYASVSWLCDRMNAAEISCPLWVARYYWDPNDPDFSGANGGTFPGSGIYTKAMQAWGEKVALWQFGRIGYADTYGIKHGSNNVDRNWLYSEPATSNAPTSSAATVDGLITLCVGPASKGDQNSITQLAKTLGVPSTIWDDGSVVVGPVSKGDQTAVYTLAEKLLLPCSICENGGDDNPGMAEAETNAKDGTYFNAKYRLPFDGLQHISSPYGTRTLNGEVGFHRGFDVVADDDKTVRAVIGGVVKSSTIIDKSTGNKTWEWGNYVKVLGTDGKYWFYCHMESRTAKVGDTVAAGAALGIEGETGYSFGKHLHLEVRDANNSTLDISAVLGIENKAQNLYQQDGNAETVADNSTATIEQLQETNASLQAEINALLDEDAKKTTYGVVLGAFTDENAAALLVNRLAAGGITATVVRY